MSDAKKTRLSKPAVLPAPQTREQAEALLANIAEAMGAQRIAIEQLDALIREAREKAAPTIEAIEERIDVMVSALEVWATAHQAEEFLGRKSLEMRHGLVGWRTGQPALKPRGGSTWADVLGELQARGVYVRQVEEVDKEKLLADRELLGKTGLEAFRLRVVQTERFFVEPQTEGQVERITA